MKTKKKLPSIVQQVREAGNDFKAWGNGKKKLRTTIMSADGSRTTSHFTRDEMDEKLKNADLIRTIRSDLKMSQPEFAKLMKVAPATVKSWEISKRNVPPIAIALAQLAHDMPSVRRWLFAAQM